MTPSLKEVFLINERVATRADMRPGTRIKITWNSAHPEEAQTATVIGPEGPRRDGWRLKDDEHPLNLEPVEFISKKAVDAGIVELLDV